MKTLEKRKNKIITNIKSKICYDSDVELLTKIGESKTGKFYDFETSYNNGLKKLKF